MMSFWVRCCILVDATRGLCKGDKMLVRFLTRYEIPWLVVLTKGDLLDCPTLARCVLAVQLDLAQYVTPAMVRAAAAANSSGSSASDISSTSRAQAVQDGSAGGSAAADTGSTDADTDTDVVESDSELQSVSHSDSGTDGGDCSSTGTVCAEEDEWSEGESGGDLATGDRDRHHLQIDHRELSRYSQLAAAEERPEGESELQDEDVEVIGSAKNDDDDGVAQEEWEEEEEEDEEEGEEEVQPKAEDLNVPNRRLVPVAVVSSSTGAGVQQLWKRLCAIARDDSVLPPGVAPSTTHVVREHRMAQTLRRRHAVQHSVDRRGRVGGSQKHVPRANSREPKPPSLRPVKLARNRRTVRARIREAAQEKLQEARKKFEEVVVN